MSAKRLLHGGRIDRETPLRFSWDGGNMTGYAGDSLASALMANGETVLGRSFKYHRPRGIMSAGVEESGAMVTLGEGKRRDPNVKATMQELYTGLVATGQNAWPNVRVDLGAVNGLFGRFFSAGFYYKTFMGLPPLEWGKGTGLWMKYESIIRKAAGMGEASREADPDVYDHAHSYCDLLVVGSGPAGLSAALTAAKTGLDVLLVEQDSQLGGDLLNQPIDVSEKQRLDLIAKLEKAGARVMTRTTAFGLYDSGVAGLLERVTDHISEPDNHLPRHRFWTVRTRQTIIASGALERNIAFGNNDRPGVMTVSAARAYMNRYAVLPGQGIVVATNNDSAYVTATELAGAGAEVSLLDARAVIPEPLMALAGSHAVSLRTRSAPLNVRGTRGVNGVDIAVEASNGWVVHGAESCDLLLVSGGWSPVVHLLSHRGFKPEWNAEQACFVGPENVDEPIYLAGAAAAVWNTDDCMKSGESAALKAIKALGGKSRQKPAPTAGGWLAPIKPLYEVSVPGRHLKSFVDMQHDVTCDDVRLAHREGFVSV
ncbi:MAG: FAD-dependent oxidoreductase, partial [Gammaproteobacteria bacterium]|nr:FAD-dependent oxidoreductase [Gammaproteobacteria bacterium]